MRFPQFLTKEYRRIYDATLRCKQGSELTGDLLCALWRNSISPYIFIIVNQETYSSKLQQMFADARLPKKEQDTEIEFNKVSYELKQDPFIVPANFKRQVPLNKNIFELKESQPKNYDKKQGSQEMTEMALLDPLKMSVASIKLLMAQKSLSFAAVFSILVSIYDVYTQNDQQLQFYVLGLGFAITVIMAILVVAAAVFHYENMITRRINQRLFLGPHLLKLVMVLVSPNPWADGSDPTLHLILLLRLYFPLAYAIRSSIYYQPRAARIINLYGIKPQFTFDFALKVLLNDMSISLVLIFYVSVVLFYSHCLYLVSTDVPFIDCFQIVMVTLPTVGYGDYQVTGAGPRIIVLFILVTGIALNAFITLTMLKQFEMTSNENNSFILMQKLKMVEQIESISSEFIMRKFSTKHTDLTAEQQQDYKFKQSYQEYKTRYRNLNPHDSIYLFNYFRDMLIELKIKVQQANNMITVLLSRLATSDRPHRRVRNVDY